MSVLKVGVAHNEHFFVYDDTTSPPTPVTGLINTDFTRVFYKNGVVQPFVSSTVTEIGAGAYVINYTLSVTGDWTAHWVNATYNPKGWKKDHTVTADGILGLADIQAYLDANSTKLAFLDAAISSRLASSDGRLANLDAAISSRLASADSRLNNLDATISSREPANDAKLLHLDADVSSRLASADGRLNNLDAAVSSREPSTDPRLAHLDADVSSRLAANAAVLNHLDANVSGVPGLVWEELQSAHVGVGTMGEQAQPRYQAYVNLLVDRLGASDRYTVTFFKDGNLVVSGIASVQLEVVKAVDGTDLIAPTSMAQIGTSGAYRYTEAVNRVVKGAAYTAKVSATIGGVAMAWTRPVGRDS